MWHRGVAVKNENFMFHKINLRAAAAKQFPGTLEEDLVMKSKVNKVQFVEGEASQWKHSLDDYGSKRKASLTQPGLSRGAAK